MGLFGPPNVEKMKAKRDVEGLIKVLCYQKDTNVRKAAAEALRQIGDAHAINPLIAMLKDKEKDVRQAVANALGQMGDACVVEPLIAALKDGASSVRKAAVGALGQIGDARAVEPLITALKDGERNVRNAAAEALGQIGDAYAIEPLLAALKEGNTSAVGALVKIGAPAVEPLIAAFKDNDKNVCERAAEALVKIGTPAVEPLIAALNDRYGVVRKAAAGILGQIGDTRAVEPLIVALKDSNSDVCKAAADALDKINWRPGQDENGAAYWISKREWNKCIEIGAPAVKPLITALKDDYDVRDAATEALVKIGTPAIEPLIAALKHNEYSVAYALDKMGWQPGRDENGAVYWTVKREWDKCIEIGAPAVKPLIAVLIKGGLLENEREAAAEALGKIGDARAVETLINALKNSYSKTRKAAAEALDKLGWQPGRDENGAAYWVAKKEWDKCVAIGAPAVKPLIAALKDSDKDVRERASEALVKIGTPAVKPLIFTLKDSNEDARKAAAKALGQIRDVRAVEPLIAILKDSNEEGRKAAAEALGKIGDARAVEPLIAALKSIDWSVQKAAAEALGQIGDTRAVKPLIAALKDRVVREVYKATAGALDKINWKPGQDENGAAYWMAKEEWDKCVAIGAPAIEPLIATLGSYYWSVRKAAAVALVKLYQSGLLGKAHTALILAQRGKISTGHNDEIKHFSETCFSNIHDDREIHTDEGIGVAFPV